MATFLQRFSPTSSLESQEGIRYLFRECLKGPNTMMQKKRKIVRIIWGAFLFRTAYNVYKTIFWWIKSLRLVFTENAVLYYFRENTDVTSVRQIFWEKHQGASLVTIRKKCLVSVSQLGLIMVMLPPESWLFYLLTYRVTQIKVSDLKWL